MQVMEAHVRRAVKQGEHLCGEVEVTTDGREDHSNSKPNRGYILLN